MSNTLNIGGKEISSRLFLGTGKFASPQIMSAALHASQCEVVTVAMKRVDLDSNEDDFLMHLNNGRFIFMPNTSGARDAEEACRIAKVCRAATGSNWIKVEIHPDSRYLLPDPIETLKACQILVREGFVVLPYINADPVLALKLQEAGCAAVMPLASPIGSNRGITVRSMLEIIIEQLTVPVIVDAGLGRPSHAADCMEMGADAVLVNTAIAVAKDPVEMADAFRLGVEAGRKAFLSGVGMESNEAIASSPLTSFLDANSSMS